MSTESAGKLQKFANVFLATAAAIVALTQLSVVWISICGASTTSVIALLIGLIVGFSCTAGLSKPAAVASFVPRTFLAVAVLVLSGSLSPLLDSSLTFGVSAAETLGVATGWAFVASGVAAAVFAWLTGTWLLACNPSFGETSSASILSGAAVGCFLPLLHIAAVLPMTVSTCVVVSLSAATTLWRRHESNLANPSRHGALIQQPRGLLAVIGFGLYCHAGLRMMNFLTPMSIPLLLMAAAITLLTMAAFANKVGRNLLHNPAVFYGSILVTLVTPLCFGSLIDWNLSWNASVDSVLGLMLWRSTQLATMVVLAGFVCRNSLRASFKHGEFSQQTLLQFTVVFLLGTTVGLMAAAAGFPIALQMWLGAGLLILPLVRLVKFNQQQPNEDAQPTSSHQMGPMLRPVAAGLLVTAGLLSSAMTSVDSAATSQRLFSARTANGLRLGLSIDLVDQSHCTRLLDQKSGHSGELTMWKTSADLIELRRNGIPAGTISTNELTTPQPLADSLTAILPLAMHPAPQHVLVLGDDSGLATRVCCNAPIPFIEVSRNDKVVTDHFAAQAWSDLEVSPLDDERVTLRHEAVATTVRRTRTANRLFDVVIASSPNPVTINCQEQLTTQFYANVRSQMNGQGVFCQRITQHDLGSDPMLRILSSLSTVFNRVVVVQVAAGEMVMIAGVNENSLLDSNVLARLERSHFTRELSRSGWDWSQIAALPVVDTSDPVGIYEHVPKLEPVTADSGFFAMSLPLESARWGNKPAELQQTFAPHQQRLADAAPRGDAYREYAIRFSAVVQQMEILSTFHDQPWAYRKSLKTEMMRNSRPAVEKVVNGGIKQVGDPRDEYRKEYLISLGKAIQQAAEGFVDPMALKELSSFTNSYEPLLSFFAHHELIRLHEAASHPGPALELRYRLHTIFFADGRDYSIRQVVAAMNQIVDSPELLPTSETRFDHLNAMLQELVRRWEGRRSYTPTSARTAQQDIEDCIRTANRALDEMEKLTVDVQMTRPQFLARRKFITKALVSPLRTYGEQVLAHRIKTEPPLETVNPWEESEELPMLLKTADSVTTN